VDANADGTAYTTCSIDGDAVCGLYEMSDEVRATGVPPSWTSYVTVADADAATARTIDLGGGSINDAFDVMELGRMAVLRDPQGAVFAVWQPHTRIGAERVNDVGCLCMNELATTDLPSARSFYEEVFGWRTESIDTGPDGPPTVFVFNGERLNASFGAVEGGTPPHWRPYFSVGSTDTAMQRVRELGGEELLPPSPHPHGSIAIARDPQGAVFALYAGETDP
jgi:predicted enzyme related to lactoylglutathione lyase